MRHFSLSFGNERLIILDQEGLPSQVKYIEIKNIKDSFQALRSLKVRGAPLIGVFAGYSLYISIKNLKTKSKKVFLKILNKNIEYLKSSRPTAVNLFWALERIKRKVLSNLNKEVNSLKDLIKEEASLIHQEDIELCRKIGQFGAKLIEPSDCILTHCNTGFLATAGEGTALSVIYTASKKYPQIKVYVDETRPLLQGARLTCWELSSRKIETILICDNMASSLMRKGKITKIIVGADRITAKGFVANKIGTYNLAVSASYHRIPFYVAAPTSTFDLSLKEERDIPIEERNSLEVKTILGRIPIAPKKVKVYNPAFDVTPPQLITAIITDRGIIKPPFEKNIRKVFKNA